jgi:hypothetical protein
MNVAQLRDYLTEHIEYTFPDIPVWVSMNGQAYEIGRIWANAHHVILEVGEEEAHSKMWSQEDSLTTLWQACFTIYLATNS